MTEIHAGQVPGGASRSAAAARGADRGADRGALHSPLIDFICLGGGSIPILVAAVLMFGDEHKAAVLVTASILAVFINNPHFMASYQIFYNRFGEKLADRGSNLRRRYWIAGVVVPVALIGYFVWCIATADPTLLGRAVNVMLFLVGWHYVKQGYGIMIVESVLQRAFLNDTEKTVLRWNGLAAWIFSWVYANRLIQTSTFQGTEYVTFGIPEAAAWITGAVALIAGIATLAVFVRLTAQNRLTLNGTCGYISAVYLWMVFAYFDPMLLMLGPAFHSLQYLAVVWRYQLNKSSKADAGEPVSMLSGLVTLSATWAGMVRFASIGLIAGTLAFSVVPMALDWAITYREELFGPSMFLFMFVVFINIHHYFMDNVMWRRENPDIKAHLFG